MQTSPKLATALLPVHLKNNRKRVSFPISLLLTFTCILSTGIAAESFPPADFKEMSSELSPEGTFKIIHFKRNPEDFSSESQIWLQDLKPDFKTQLLFTHHNRADWLINPDEDFIAINHHEGSGSGLLHVFSRDKAGLFREKQKDFIEVTRKLMIAQLKLDKETGFDHFYCYADAWLRDGLLLGHLEGHESGTHFLRPWYFIYDAKNDKFLWDLSRINQNAFQLVKPKKP